MTFNSEFGKKKLLPMTRATFSGLLGGNVSLGRKVGPAVPQYKVLLHC